MRSDLLCRVWIGESWLRSQFVCINITLPPPYPCTLWKVMLAQNVRFFASKSLLQIQLVESESDIDTKSLQSFCIKIIPPPPSPCPPHPPCSPGIWCFVIYPTMHCNVSWLTIREVSVKKIICSRDCVVTQKWKWYWSHFSLVSRKSEPPDVTCSREWVVPRILLTESFSPFPMLSASSLFKVMRAKQQLLSGER